MKLRFMFECEDSQERRVREVMKSEFGIELKRWRNNSRLLICGSGFGNKVWRVNYAKDRVEASFDHSCHQSRALEKAGFELESETGIWHSAHDEFSVGICRLLRLAEVDSVMK